MFNRSIQSYRLIHLYYIPLLHTVLNTYISLQFRKRIMMYHFWNDIFLIFHVKAFLLRWLTITMIILLNRWFFKFRSFNLSRGYSRRYIITVISFIYRNTAIWMTILNFTFRFRFIFKIELLKWHLICDLFLTVCIASLWNI